VSILCIGAAHVDFHAVLRGPAILGTSNRGGVRRGFGGVARNVAENLARLDTKVALVSRVGEDPTGAEVLGHAVSLGIDIALVTRSADHPTASYTAVLEDSGELVIGIADADIYDEIDPAMLERFLPDFRLHRPWFLDTNLPAETLAFLLHAAADTPVYVDAVSVVRAQRLRSLMSGISVLFVNLAQASSIAESPFADAQTAARALQLRGANSGVVTNGEAGAVVWNGDGVVALPAFPAIPRDVTGAGDALIAGTLFGVVQGLPLPRAVELGLAAAAITVESENSAAPELDEISLRKRAAHGA
jgi:pseudouridine kinase